MSRTVITIETTLEDDGRHLAIVRALPGVMAYGATMQDAVRAVVVLALQVIADLIEHGEPVPEGLREHLYEVAAG